MNGTPTLFPEPEEKRLQALRAYQILDTAPEPYFDDLTALAAQICEAPFALITLVDEKRQWFKSSIGFDVSETVVEIAFCRHSILGQELFVVPDAKVDPRFSENPLVAGAPHIRFYAGAPLISRDGYALGTLCVIDTVPRELRPNQLHALKTLSRHVMTQLELRRSDASRKEAEERLQKLNAELEERVRERTSAANQARREAEAARRAIEEIFDRVSDGVVAMDREWRYTYINANAARLIGCAPENLLGRCAWDVFPIAVGKPFHAACHEAMEEQKPRDYEQYFAVWGRWLTGRIYPSPEGVSLFFQDTTERKQREQELEEANARLQLAVTVSGVGLWDWNPVTDEIYFSPEWKVNLGYTDAELPNRRDVWEALLHPEDQVQIGAYVEQLLSGTASFFDRDLRLRHRDGSYRWVLSRAKIYRDEEGKAVRLLGCHIDVTERKESESRLRRSKAQLRALAAHLQSVREEEATRIARELHDELGAALTGLKFDATWLERQLAAGSAHENSAAMHGRVCAMIEMVDTTIQNVRKICRDLRPAVLDQLGLATAIEWQAAEFQSRTGIRCVVNRPDHVDVAPLRATTIFRIFQEMLTNVARHAQATEVEVSLHQCGAELILTTRDNGRGAEPEKLDQPNHFGIVGMRERAFAAGGSLDIATAPGGGMSVTVRIPCLPGGGVGNHA